MEVLIKKLLWQQKSRWQLIAAIIGTALGLFLVITSLQVYFDIQSVLQGEKEGEGQYLIINKRVNLFNSLGVRSVFTEEEIQTIKQQSFVEKTGRFEPNLYRVSASSSALGFYTELFFEAVEDEFVDVETSDFAWREGQRELPIILSKDYLALYNFGFAPSQGLPQFTPSTIGRVTLDITIKGQGISKVFKGRVAGFSDRINSILVPMTFMQWANANYGNGEQKEASRLLLKTDPAFSNQLENFLADNGYELSSGRLISSQASTLLHLLLGILLIIGFIIFALSVVVFILNFQLFVAQSKEDIRLLLQLGHHSKSIIQLLFKRLLIVFGIIILVVLLVVYIFRKWMINWVETQGFLINNSIHPFVLLATIAIIALFLGINYWSIRKSVKALF